jgi:hypothetical protein
MWVCKSARKYELSNPFRHTGTPAVEQAPLVRRYLPAVSFIPRALILALLVSLWSRGAAVAQAPERSVLRQLYGDVALEVRTRGQGSVRMGAADDRTSLAFTLLAIDLRRWSDSASRVLAAKPPKKGTYVRWEAVVAGPGVAAGSMSLARMINPSDTSIILLVTDTAFRGVRTRLSIDEARALTAAMKRAALASLPTTVPPMTKAPPATKPPGQPPPKKPPPSRP